MKKKITLLLLIIGVISIAVFARAVNPNEFLEFISNVYSQRQFNDSSISDDSIQKILAAGHKAPSARNAQPWHFTVVRNKAMIDEIMPNVVDNNVLIVVSGQTNNPFSPEFDTALATQNMFLAAQALGIGARIYVMPVPNINENLLGKLNIPENHKVTAVLRLGYESADVDVTTAASPRQPLENKVNHVN